MSFMLSVAVGAPTGSKVKSAAVKPRAIWVYVTDSRIPQRVVLMGQQVNSASPIYVVQGDELHRTGASNIIGALSLDPSISVRSRTR